MTLAGQTVHHASIGVSEAPGRLCGTSVAGNIGYDLLRNFRVTIDYAGKRVAVNEPPPAPIQAGTAMRIPGEAKPLIILDATIDGRGPHPFAVGTGAGGTLIAPELVDELGLIGGQPVKCAGCAGVMEGRIAPRSVPVSVGSGSTISIQPLILDMFDMLSRDGGEKIVGLIGHDVLSRHILTIDSPGNRLRLP